MRLHWLQIQSSPRRKATRPQVGDAWFAVFVCAAWDGETQSASFFLNQLNQRNPTQFFCPETQQTNTRTHTHNRQSRHWWQHGFMTPNLSDSLRNYMGYANELCFSHLTKDDKYYEFSILQMLEIVLKCYNTTNLH